MEVNIDELPTRLRDLDESAYTAFATVFGPRLRSYFLALGSCPADAESLSVSCLTDLALKADRFEDRGPGSFGRWVFASARHAWIDERRRRGVTLLPDLDAADEATRHLDDESRASCEEAVANALQTLPEVDRAILTYRYFDDVHSFSEIGQRVGMSDVTVRVRHHRALKKLSRLLGVYRPDGPRATSNVKDSDHE